MNLINLHSITPHLFKVPLEKPVITSFGVMNARWALWICVKDYEGAYGWGEVWCNFPDSGALHRCRLLTEVFLPLIPKLQGEHPAQISSFIASKIRILKLQSAEYGPLDQCSAGIDTAIWDLYSRRLNQPLHRVLAKELHGEEAKKTKNPSIRAYASGINPIGVGKALQNAADIGHRSFKVKIGFENAQDLRTLREARDAAGQAWLAADANQAWSSDHAANLIPQFAQFNLAWLEEPVAADTSPQEWLQLSKIAPMPLAAGENINNITIFKDAIEHWGLGFIQPDLAKWGGLTGCLEVIKFTQSSGLTYCPHYLGGGIGLLASAHLLAASGQEGLLEMDINPNPLRSEVLADELKLSKGLVELKEKPGLGIEPNLLLLKSWVQTVPF